MIYFTDKNGFGKCAPRLPKGILRCDYCWRLFHAGRPGSGQYRRYHYSPPTPACPTCYYWATDPDDILYYRFAVRNDSILRAIMEEAHSWTQ